MAHVLQDNFMVTEMYLSDGNIPQSKNLLMIYKDGTLEMKWCCGDYIRKESNPTLTKVGRRMILEYGDPNLFGIRPTLPFQDEQGQLDKIWEKLM